MVPNIKINALKVDTTTIYITVFSWSSINGSDFLPCLNTWIQVTDYHGWTPNYKAWFKDLDTWFGKIRKVLMIFLSLAQEPDLQDMQKNSTVSWLKWDKKVILSVIKYFILIKTSILTNTVMKYLSLIFNASSIKLLK